MIRHKLKEDTLNVTFLLGKLAQIILFTGETAAVMITNEVARAIVDNMFEEVTSLLLRTSEQVQQMMRFNTPFSFAALDGRHAPIKCLDVAGRRDYHNYKNFYSIILMAMVDGKGRFIWAQAGMPGNVHDSTIMRSTRSGAHYPITITINLVQCQLGNF